MITQAVRYHMFTPNLWTWDSNSIGASGCFSRGRRRRREADYSLPSRSEYQIQCRCASTSPCVFIVCIGTTLLLAVCLLVDIQMWLRFWIYLIEDAKYLNSLHSIITNGTRSARAIKSRIALWKAAFNKKKTLFTSKLDSNLKKKLFKFYIWSKALYRAET